MQRKTSKENLTIRLTDTQRKGVSKVAGRSGYKKTQLVRAAIHALVESKMSDDELMRLVAESSR